MDTSSSVGYPYRDVIKAPNLETQTKVSANQQIEFMEESTVQARV